MNLSAPRGTQDILPEAIPAWRKLEDALRTVFGRFGYEEVRVPIFEQTRLFNRAVGDATDIVEKEMFTFSTGGADDEGDTLSLRPELTAGVVRALVEHNTLSNNPFVKLWYAGPAFRKERPQKGRFRQFHQFGVEAIGSNDPLVDVETLLALTSILKEVGVTGYEIHLNSIGCASCRPAYRETLKKAAEPTLGERCGNCKARFGRNVLRLLDCKVEHDRELSRAMPGMVDLLCADCRAHFDRVQAALAAEGVAYTLDKLLVRGLDYYTKTVYELTSPALGSQDALGAGGRYDNLVAELGGPAAGGVGFAAGFERVLLAMSEKPKAANLDLYVLYVEDKNKSDAFRLLGRFRQAGLSAAMDFESRRLKYQFREATRAGARYAVIVGDEEMGRGVVKLKDLSTAAQKEVSVDEAIRLVRG